MRQQAPKPGVIAQNGIEAEVPQFKSFCVYQPISIGFRADRLPHTFSRR